MRSGSTVVHLGVFNATDRFRRSDSEEWLLSLSDSEFDQAVASLKASGAMTEAEAKQLRLDRSIRMYASRTQFTLPAPLGSEAVGPVGGAGSRQGQIREGEAYFLDEKTGEYVKPVPPPPRNRVEDFISNFFCKDRTGIDKAACQLSHGIGLIAGVAVVGVVLWAIR